MILALFAQMVRAIASDSGVAKAQVSTILSMVSDALRSKKCAFAVYIVL